ncbi:LemA family protein [Evansella halocellulosilytica]|uniref:LemA family protein n=1 Tax=Evansella halocellulosilytica TaxID=2011013 RepID=UPI0015CA5283|nr:LemA family protein [Evansella halocellulosilytica]
MGIIITFIALGIVVLFVITSYNGVKKKGVSVDTAYRDLDAVLEQRWDQIQNLISAVKNEVKAETEHVEKVVAMRAGVENAKTPNEKIEANQKLESAISGFRLQVENYPDTNFNEGFRHLQKNISHLEETLQAARRNYNSHVKVFNQYIAVFPRNMIASMFNFEARTFFEATEHKREAPSVDKMFG